MERLSCRRAAECKTWRWTFSQCLLYHALLDLTDSFMQTVVSPLPQDSWVAADTDRGITWQTGSVETALGVPGLADGGDAHPVPVATEGAAATGHNPLAESLRQACRNNTITNGASVSPATTEAPDLDVPQTEDGIGDQSSAAGVDLAVPHTKDGTGERMFTAGVDLAVPHIEEGIGERALSAGVNLAVPHIKTGIGEQSFAAGVEQQHDSVLLEDASSVTTAKVWLNWHIRKS